MNKLIQELINLSTERVELNICGDDTIDTEMVFNKEKFAELIVRVCIYQIQRGIVRNGITPENKRSEKHISDIAHLFDMEFVYFGDDQ